MNSNSSNTGRKRSLSRAILDRRQTFPVKNGERKKINVISSGRKRFCSSTNRVWTNGNGNGYERNWHQLSETISSAFRTPEKMSRNFLKSFNSVPSKSSNKKENSSHSMSCSNSERTQNAINNVVNSSKNSNIGPIFDSNTSEIDDLHDKISKLIAENLSLQRENKQFVEIHKSLNFDCEFGVKIYVKQIEILNEEVKILREKLALSEQLSVDSGAIRAQNDNDLLTKSVLSQSEISSNLKQENEILKEKLTEMKNTLKEKSKFRSASRKDIDERHIQSQITSKFDDYKTKIRQISEEKNELIDKLESRDNELNKLRMETEINNCLINASSKMAAKVAFKYQKAQLKSLRDEVSNLRRDENSLKNFCFAEFNEMNAILGQWSTAVKVLAQQSC